MTLARVSHQRSPVVEANARRQGCRGAIHRARLPTYGTLGDVHGLLPRAMAAGPFASFTAALVRMRASPNTVHLAATDARIAPWDSELDAKVVGTGKVAARRLPGRHVGALDRRDRRSLLPQLVTTQVGTSDPACPGRDMSRPYMADGAMRGRVRWFPDSLSERYWG